MSVPTTPAKTPYRADHVGSLLRPQDVLDAHAAAAAGTITEAQLREIEDRAILRQNRLRCEQTCERSPVGPRPVDVVERWIYCQASQK